jgi:hypothetical protein
MQALVDIDWTGIGALGHGGGEPRGPVPDFVDPAFVTVCLGCVAGFGPADAVLYRMWERDCYLMAQDECDKIYQGYLPGKSMSEARRLTVESYTQRKIDRIAPSPAYGHCNLHPEHIREAVSLILRRASRWLELINAIGSQEVILVDQDKAIVNSDKTFGQILDGTVEEFEELKRFLLDPVNGFRDNCLQLTGLSNMIHDMANAPLDSVLRRYLEEHVKLRIRSIYGDPIKFINEVAAEAPSAVADQQQFDVVNVLGIMISVKEPSANSMSPPAGESLISYYSH